MGRIARTCFVALQRFHSSSASCRLLPRTFHQLPKTLARVSALRNCDECEETTKFAASGTTHTRVHMEIVQDVGSVVALEHLNLNIPDQMIANHFYLDALGLTRDPYERVTTTAWVNVGQQQFHLVLSDHAQVIRGHIGLVIPVEATVGERLARMSTSGTLSSTKFAWEEVTASGERPWYKVTGPWGNSFHVFETSSAAFAYANRGDTKAFLSPAYSYVPSMRGGIGIAFIEETCGVGKLDHIERFYRDLLEAPVRRLVVDGAPLGVLQVRMGPVTQLYFREVEIEAPWSGHHICIYITRFSVIHSKCAAAGCLFTENRFSDTYATLGEALSWSQFRASDMHDGDRNLVYQLEHEVRSIAHPYYLRPLANRYGNVGIMQPVTPHHEVFHGWFEPQRFK